METKKNHEKALPW